MFHLQMTKMLQGMAFNALVLSAIEMDALNLAAAKLELRNPGTQFTSEDLYREANAMLPQNQADATRIYFATQHQIQDDRFDDARNLGNFISQRAEAIESRAKAELDGSKSMMGWINALSQLAEGYSYVIEAAENLQDQGLMAMRHASDLQALTVRPDENSNMSGAMLYDKAMAFYAQRNDTEKPLLKEQFR